MPAIVTARRTLVTLAAAQVLTLGVLSSALAAPIVTASSDAAALTGTLLGAGINVVGTPTLSGAAGQAGSFTGGTTTTIGFATGVVLSSGNVTSLPGTNANPGSIETLGDQNVQPDDLSTDFGGPGDANLTALAGTATEDASVLEFQFQFGDGSDGGDLFFSFAFGSDEYIDFVSSSFNDAFGFFVDGTNVALVPGTSTPITINTINPNVNSGFYINNVPNTNGLPVAGLDVRLDGITRVIGAEILGLGPGVHTMKFAIADAFDDEFDSAVFLAAGTFRTEPPPGIGTGSGGTGTMGGGGEVPEPATLTLLGLGLAGLAAARRQRRQ
jgi:PEP-CTERM motif